jgi:hypothetical protein
MPNPVLLPCDSDVLVQLFLVSSLRPLQELKKRFAIQPTISIEVDLELRWVGKYKDRFVPQLDKALKHGTLVKLDQSLFQSLLSGAAPGTSWGTYQALGAQYYGYVQRGEAYTHAAAVTLGLPAVSNDQRAVLVLQSQMLRLPAPVLRCFDLLIFAHQAGILALDECETIRKELLKNGEGVPGSFVHASFEDGAKKFPCRLKQGSASGGHLVAPPIRYHDPLVILPA